MAETFESALRVLSRPEARKLIRAAVVGIRRSTLSHGPARRKNKTTRKHQPSRREEDELAQIARLVVVRLRRMSLFNFVTGFVTGVYAGLYAAKHYNVPDVPEPQTLVEKVKKFLDANKKDD